MTPLTADRLTKLHRISHIVTTKSDTDFPNQLTELVTDLFESDGCIIAMLVENKTKLKIITEFPPRETKTVSNLIPFDRSTLAKKISQARTSIVIPQPPSDPLLMPQTQRRLMTHHPGCLLGLPLASNGKSVGVMLIVSYRVGQVFSISERTLAEILAAQIAMALGNLKLQTDLQTRTKEMLTLAGVGRDVLMSLDLTGLLKRIAVRATDMLPNSTVMLYTRQGEAELVPLFTAGPPVKRLQKHTIPIGKGIIGTIAQTWGAEIITNVALDQRAVAVPDKQMVADVPRGLMAASLISKEDVMGVIVAWRPLVIGGFTDANLNFLIGIAQQMVIASENSALYQEIRHKKRLFETLLMHSPVATVILDVADKVVVSWNPAAEALFGYTRAEAVGQDIHALINSKLTETAAVDYTKLSDSSESQTFIMQGKQQDGRAVYVELLAVPVMIDNKRVNDLILYHDITELEWARKEVEYTNAALSEVNHELQFLAHRLQGELNLAHQIQASLLPGAKPDWPNLDAICYSIPAREVGGDLYAYHVHRGTNPQTHPGHYAIAVGDVSGKGMPAALLMAVSMASFQALMGQGLSPGMLLSRLDKSISRFTEKSRQNCALVYAEITPPHFKPLDNDDDADKLTQRDTAPDLPTVGALKLGHLRVANAGCIPPYVRRTNGSIEAVDIGGVPLGLGLGRQFGYHEATTTLSQGDLVIFTSDGVVEATNTINEMFGFERLEESIRTGPQTNAEAMLDHLKQQVFSFTSNAEQHDDLTIVVVQA